MGLAKGRESEGNQTIVVENAPRGVEAAVAAGILIAHLNAIPDKDFGSTGLLLPSMKALLEIFVKW